MKVVTKHDEKGKVMYTSDIINAVAKCALEEIEGVAKVGASGSKVSRRYRSGVKVDTVGDMIYVDVFVKLYDNVSVKDVSYTIQRTIKNTLETMTDFKIKAVNVHVVDVEHQKKEKIITPVE